MAGTYNSLVDAADLGPLIPQPVASDIVKTLPESSAALRLCRTVRMSSKTLTQGVLATLPVAYWVNGATGLKQTTELHWAGVTLTAEEIATVLPIPEVLIDDAGFPIWAEARPLLAEAIGRLLDQTVFNGRGGATPTKPASWPEGLIPQAIAKGNIEVLDSTPAQGGAANDLLNAFGIVEGDGYDVTGVAADKALRGSLRAARDTTGQKLIDVSVNEVEGVPIVYTPFGVFPAGSSALVGDWSMAIIGIRQDITWKLLDQAVISDDTGKVILNLAQQDAVAMRVVARFGFAIANPVTRSLAANPWPFAVVGSAPALQDAPGQTEIDTTVTEADQERLERKQREREEREQAEREAQSESAESETTTSETTTRRTRSSGR